MILGMSSVETIDLETGVSEACGRLNVVYGQMVGFVVELLRTRSWEGSGIRSPEHWLRWKTGASSSRANDLVLLATRAAELPVTIATLKEGMLSFDQAVTIARYTPTGYDAAACELAKSLSVPQLGSVLRRYSFTPRHANVHDDTVATDASTDDASDAASDRDRDGLSALDEYMIGTNPAAYDVLKTLASQAAAVFNRFAGVSVRRVVRAK